MAGSRRGFIMGRCLAQACRRTLQRTASESARDRDAVYHHDGLVPSRNARLRGKVLEGFLLGIASTVCIALIAGLVLLGRATLQSIDAWEKRLRKPRASRRRLTHDRI
jgi:hypothetical protein